MSRIVTYALAFGDVFQECYILAAAGSRIEMRVTGNDPTGTSWFQALLAMHGQLLKAQGQELPLEPGSQRAVTVTGE
jgi:hypothetical protein